MNKSSIWDIYSHPVAFAVSSNARLLVDFRAKLNYSMHARRSFRLERPASHGEQLVCNLCRKSSLQLSLCDFQPGLLEQYSELALFPTVVSKHGFSWVQFPHLVTLLSTGSKASEPLVLKFSLITMKPPSGLSVALHRSR